MATIKLIDVRNNDERIDVLYVNLFRHTPLDVLIMIYERDLAQKPPKGSIWLMKKPAGAPGDTEINYFATLEENKINENIICDLIPCP